MVLRVAQNHENNLFFDSFERQGAILNLLIMPFSIAAKNPVIHRPGSL